MLDQRRTERGHRGVLLRAVAERDDNGDRQAEAAARPGQRLAVVAAGGGDQTPTVARPLLRLGKDNPAAHLESAGRKVVFVFDPDLGAGPLRSATASMICGVAGKMGMHQVCRIAGGPPGKTCVGSLSGRRPCRRFGAA